MPDRIDRVNEKLDSIDDELDRISEQNDIDEERNSRSIFSSLKEKRWFLAMMILVIFIALVTSLVVIK